MNLDTAKGVSILPSGFMIKAEEVSIDYRQLYLKYINDTSFENYVKLMEATAEALGPSVVWCNFVKLQTANRHLSPLGFRFINTFIPGVETESSIDKVYWVGDFRVKEDDADISEVNSRKLSGICTNENGDIYLTIGRIFSDKAIGHKFFKLLFLSK